MADEDGGSLAVVKAVGGSALWAAGAAGSYVGGAISSYVAGSASSEAKPREGAEPACLRPLGGGEILRIANTLNGIFSTSAGDIGVGRPLLPTKSPTPLVSLIRKKTSCGMRPSFSSRISTKM